MEHQIKSKSGLLCKETLFEKITAIRGGREIIIRRICQHTSVGISKARQKRTFLLQGRINKTKENGM